MKRNIKAHVFHYIFYKINSFEPVHSEQQKRTINGFKSQNLQIGSLANTHTTLITNERFAKNKSNTLELIENKLKTNCEWIERIRRAANSLLVYIFRVLRLTLVFAISHRHFSTFSIFIRSRLFLLYFKCERTTSSKPAILI